MGVVALRITGLYLALITLVVRADARGVAVRGRVAHQRAAPGSRPTGPSGCSTTATSSTSAWRSCWSRSTSTGGCCAPRPAGRCWRSRRTSGSRRPSASTSRRSSCSRSCCPARSPASPARCSPTGIGIVTGVRPRLQPGADLRAHDRRRRPRHRGSAWCSARRCSPRSATCSTRPGCTACRVPRRTCVVRQRVGEGQRRAVRRRLHRRARPAADDRAVPRRHRAADHGRSRAGCGGKPFTLHDDRTAARPRWRAPVSVLEVRDLSIRFGGLQALQDVNLEVNEFEIVGLIGPNGAGKTTAFNCITGFYTAQHGHGALPRQGRHEGPAARARRAMGFGRTFQNVGMVKSATALENLKTAQHAKAAYDAAGRGCSAWAGPGRASSTSRTSPSITSSTRPRAQRCSLPTSARARRGHAGTRPHALHVGLPRGDVGSRAVGRLGARLRLRCVRERALRATPPDSGVVCVRGGAQR